MTRLVNCRLLDPSSGDPVRGWLELHEGMIARVEYGDAGGGGPDAGYDCRGSLVLPSFVDLYADIGEPGFEHREDIESVSASAAAGGYTTVCAAPVTDPVCDGAEIAGYIVSRAGSVGLVDIQPIGAMFKGGQGPGLSRMGELAGAGVRCVGDGGHWQVDTGLVRRAIEYARNFGLVPVLSCQDATLAEGSIHEGIVAATTGLGSIPAEAEAIGTARNLYLHGRGPGTVHLSKLSTAASVELVRRAKDEGIDVFASVPVHNLVLTEEAVRGFDTDAKLSPPLRSEEDREALVAGLADGTIDAVVSDHCPRAQEEKDVEFESAATGAVALEITFPIVFGLVRSGHIDMARAVELLCAAPRRLLGLEGGRIEPGLPADLVLVDTEARWTVDPGSMKSKSSNTPLAGRVLQGRVTMTFKQGLPVFYPNGEG